MVVEEMGNWSDESVIACAIAMHEKCRFALVISSTLEQISGVTSLAVRSDLFAGRLLQDDQKIIVGELNEQMLAPGNG
jgi:hypothetical protein